MKQLKAILFTISLISTFSIYGQTKFELAEKGNKVQVIGTSNLHDWELVSEEVKGNAELYIEEGEITGIKKVVVTLATNSLESEKNGLTKNAHRTMGAEANPVISFIAFDMGDNGEASGILNVAGFDKDIELAYNYEMKGEDLIVTCETEVTFSDFNMKAPSILAGTIKTAEEVQLKVNLILHKAN